MLPVLLQHLLLTMTIMICDNDYNDIYCDYDDGDEHPQVVDPQGAVELASSALAAGKPPKAVTNRLLHEAVVSRRARDNVTVMLVLLGKVRGECRQLAGQGGVG